MKNYPAIDSLLNNAELLVWNEIEREVTKILLSNNTIAKGFICAMGEWFFIDKNGEGIPDKRWMKRIDNIFYKYNGIFNLYGEGVRWDVNSSGAIIKTKDW